eukprot:gnl/Trimastix_PCT/318.p1 GENE.gnl/Trimastix_PCT/318~~gnl/Trimastix_PCT/318.p1  ORF type:complete len:409 (-),score=87.51 gnl/Trimastix_PCT/318:73-1236(-)
MTDRQHVIVLDQGTGFVKCGFAGDNFPRAVFPSMVGRPILRYEDSGGSTELKSIMCGTECAANRSGLRVTYPVTNARITRWDDMEHLWDYTFERMGIDPKECYILLTEAPHNSLEDRKKMLGMMFEKYGFLGCHVATQAVLTLYAQGLMTGVVLDSGDGSTHIVPVYDGFILEDSITRMDIAGRDITEYLIDLLQIRGYAFTKPQDLDLVRPIKEKFCYVGYDLDLEERLSQETTTLVETYQLPDGRVVKMGRERYMAPECLFQPHLIGKDEVPGVHEQLFNAINKCDIDLRAQFYQLIVLSGGTSMYPGLPSRLQKEMKALYLENILRGNTEGLKRFKLRIESPPRRKHFVFSGGAVLADVAKDNPQFWTLKEDWQARGPSILDPK